MNIFFISYLEAASTSRKALKENHIMKSSLIRHSVIYVSQNEKISTFTRVLNSKF